MKEEKEGYRERGRKGGREEEREGEGKKLFFHSFINTEIIAVSIS